MEMFHPENAGFAGIPPNTENVNSSTCCVVGFPRDNVGLRSEFSCKRSQRKTACRPRFLRILSTEPENNLSMTLCELYTILCDQGFDERRADMAIMLVGGPADTVCEFSAIFKPVQVIEKAIFSYAGNIQYAKGLP